MYRPAQRYGGAGGCSDGGISHSIPPSSHWKFCSEGEIGHGLDDGDSHLTVSVLSGGRSGFHFFVDLGPDMYCVKYIYLRTYVFCMMANMIQ